MDFSHPLNVVTPTLDGDVLAALAGADDEFSGRRLHKVVGHGSEQGIRKAADRLVAQGIVHMRQVGRAKAYRLNRQHLAAPHIEGLAMARQELLARLRRSFDSWETSPAWALLFGSVAVGEGTRYSDLDLVVIRPSNVATEAHQWLEQLANLEREASEWTGNEARIVEFGEDELNREDELLDAAVATGIELFGSRRLLRRVIEASR